ncbi:hypothetical protein [Levilactobacillus brevis]|uniref:hypothetical protein n=1 Tax=Levilactobacillus brevis TaxID=1580 RepID=UPI0039E24D00
MSRWIKVLILGLSVCAGLVVFGLPSTVHAYKVVTPGYSSHMKNKIPKALHGKWYMGKEKVKFTRYYKMPSDKSYVITQHLVNEYCYVGHKKLKAKGYFDGIYSKKDGFDFGFQYVPLVFSYHGHNHKGLDVTGHDPDVLYTRIKTHNRLSLNGYMNSHKVKLVHIGF